MRVQSKILGLCCLSMCLMGELSAQTYNWIHSSENGMWEQSIVRLKSGVTENPDLIVDEHSKIGMFKTWGVTFNELCWDALGILTREEQDEILKNVICRRR